MGQQEKIPAVLKRGMMQERNVTHAPGMFRYGIDGRARVW